MASKKTLNAKNLETLGATQLAELLMELSKGNATSKRRLRFALAGAQGEVELAKEVRKRLTTIGRSRSFVDWHEIKYLISDLENQRLAIVEQIAPKLADEALELLWRFLRLAESVFERCDGSNGGVIDVFHQACDDLGQIAVVAKPDAVSLADQVYDGLLENGYGQYDYLIKTLSPALGESGLEHLKQRFISLSNEPVPEVRKEDRQVIGWGSNGPLYADELRESSRKSTISIALQEIADARGDVDAYIAQKSEKARTVPTVATDIATRLLDASRPEEAWQAINAVDADRPGWIPFEWEEKRAEILIALGRNDEAHEFRWACFERSLSIDHLKTYLKLLPDFDDIEAEERAMKYAIQYSNVHQALHFLLHWPTLDKAAQLVLTRAKEIDGNHYEVLTPAGDALETKYPLAATLLRRTMIDFALEKARVKRYRHAARHLMECKSLAGVIDDFQTFETHEEFAARLKAVHGKKSSFWNLAD